MNRSRYFNYIEEKLSVLSYRIIERGKINLLDLNIYSETFFAELMNLLFGYGLKNINAFKQNMAGIDLIDEKNEVIFQVSSLCTKQKIEDALSKDIFKSYNGFQFKFIAIAGDAANLRSKTYNNPYKANFNPQTDIYDIKSLLNIILNMGIVKQRELYDFLKEELGSEPDIYKLDSNITTIINILSQEDLSNTNECPEINSFEIKRKIEFNNLQAVEKIIEDYKVYYSRLAEKYKEFDRQGANKSSSVLAAIRKQYVKLSSKKMNPQAIFLGVINSVVEIVVKSKNYVFIPIEELDMCVSILVVDAFIRCKIFENPEKYQYVAT